MTDTPYIAARRSRSIAAALLALGTFSLAACSDAPVAPRAAASPLPTPSALLTYATGGVEITAQSVVNGVTYTTAVVDPRTSITFGGDDSKVTIPAYAICNPLTSGYGASYWDAPCSPATTSLVFKVKEWTDAAGNSRVEFSPDVRFSPSKVVGLYLKAAATTGANATIAWCRTGATTCVNEARVDGSLATQRDAATGFVYRRVKHFSGYMVTVGLDDPPSNDSTPPGGW